MRTIRTPGTLTPRTCLLALMVFMCLVTGLHAQEVSKPKPMVTATPDVMVLVRFGVNGDNIGSIAYPQIVKKDQAEADLEKLVGETNWQVFNVSVTSDDQMPSNGQQPMTTIDFFFGGNYNFQSGVLPIEYVIQALKNYETIQIIFIMPEDFAYRGVGDFENRYVKISAKYGIGMYTYDVTVKDSSFDRLVLPLPETDKGTVPVPKQGRRTWTIPLLLFLGLAAAGTVFLLTNRMMKKRR